MKKMLLAAVAAMIALPGATLANDRYATPPPIVLSPDLAAPWVMQLAGQRLPTGVAQPQRKVIVTRQSGQRQVYNPAPVQQASVRPACGFS